MEDALIVLSATLVGALASIATVWVQLNNKQRADVTRMAAELAIEDHRTALEAGRASGRPYKLAPLSAYVLIHSHLLRSIYSGPVSEKDIERLRREAANFLDQFDSPV